MREKKYSRNFQAMFIVKGINVPHYTMTLHLVGRSWCNVCLLGVLINAYLGADSKYSNLTIENWRWRTMLMLHPAGKFDRVGCWCTHPIKFVVTFFVSVILFNWQSFLFVLGSCTILSALVVTCVSMFETKFNIKYECKAHQRLFSAFCLC